MTEVWGSSEPREEETRRHTPGTPCWTSLLVHDLEAIEEFYSGLFGWSYYSPGPRQLGPYVRATLDGRDVAGIGGLPPDRQLAGAWTTYLASDDADVCADWIHCAGGTVGVGPLAAEEAGRLVLAADPAGALFGVWQGQAFPGPRRVGTPGTPVWHELVTHEASTVLKFYRGLFGYETKATGSVGAETHTLYVKGRPVAAIKGVGPELRSPHWMTYFAVADPAAAARRVTELGGRVLDAPHGTSAGTAVTVADPEGAVFTLVRTEP
ncbi:glyoxalase/bleomycin resistance/extradiol dioxygenase family protein [Streptomyces cinnamoneus]|uniref:Glyoxalase/bleomycin resistance/extradiol dioxygenase family protein n=1 Tax=Streptomyces cinnamoneus TaxID=53446 RepID=A0A2G1X9F9_STRCJ|nr:VOC family protein [Streptomyces cinnamoneus]PHQ47862.1 glyoxalase/bleomycin resistance/extradiol dioxygenase family protein [Streptomyces cinnamoneus]PPT15487.1 VOC family protein [Streptomyces cinnamoneus]